jgi:hypothetical protein
MNKLNLFAIIGIVSAFATALIFGSIVTPVSAQENTTMTMDNMTMDNMTMPMNNMSNMNMTMATDSVVIGESQVDPPIIAAPPGGEGSDSGGDDSGGDDSGGDDSSEEDSDGGDNN